MNPSGKNELVTDNLLLNLSKLTDEEYKKFTIIVTSTPDFQLMEQWDNLTKRLNIPYYNLVCSGLFAFSFISLGQSYTYKTIDKQKNKISKINTIDSLPLL